MTDVGLSAMTRLKMFGSLRATGRLAGLVPLVFSLVLEMADGLKSALGYKAEHRERKLEAHKPEPALMSRGANG